MNIDFILLEHREDINNLMDVCGISLEEAYHLYHHHACNLTVIPQLCSLQSVQN